MSEITVPQPGFRLIQGEWRYSARWLDDARPAMSALERARRAWAKRHDQLELPFHDDEEGDA